MHYLNRANKQERSFCSIDRFANGKRNYGYCKERITEDLHKDKRDELKKQKENIDADIAKIKTDEEELRAKRLEAQKKCNAEKYKLNKALKSAEAKVESKGPEGYAAQLLEIEAVKDEETQLYIEREKEKTKLSTYFKWDNIGLETLIEKIFRLPGTYVYSGIERIIYLDCQNKNRNKHEQEFNRMMERACMELSRSNIKLKDGRLLRMKYVTSPRHHFGLIPHFTERRDNCQKPPPSTT